MTKKMRELLAKKAALIIEAETLQNDTNASVELINAKTDEIKAINAKIEAQKLIDETDDLSGSEMKDNEKEDEENNEDGQVEAKAKYKNVLCKVLRNEVLNKEEKQLLGEYKALSSNTGEDGGYIIPIDQNTRINELKRDFTALENFVSVEPVITLSGSRVLEKEADTTPFTDFDEDDDVPDSDSPQFEKIEYSIKDRGGFLPIPNNLLNDSNQNLMAYIEGWVKKKDKATKNKLILDLLGTLSKKGIADVDDIKTILNVDLDPAISAGALILTNQDGYNYLDTLKDEDGKYILQPDATQPGRKLLGGKPVYPISNKILKTTGTTTKKAPIILGDLKEAVVLFDRQQLSILSTNVGGTAFRKNRTEIRAINRVDVQEFDTKAVVYGEITLGA